MQNQSKQHIVEFVGVGPRPFKGACHGTHSTWAAAWLLDAPKASLEHCRSGFLPKKVTSRQVESNLKFRQRVNPQLNQVVALNIASTPTTLNRKTMRHPVKTQTHPGTGHQTTLYF